MCLYVVWGWCVMSMTCLLFDVFRTKRKDYNFYVHRTKAELFPSLQHPTFPAPSRHFGVCAEPVCARARDYSTPLQTTPVTKITFDDLT